MFVFGKIYKYNVFKISDHPAGIYLLKFNFFIVNFGHISHLVLVFLLLTLSR